jgi:hypothetical protein
MTDQNQTQPQEQQQAAGPRPGTSLIRVGRTGIIISSMEELWRFSVCVWRAGMVPKGFKNIEAVVTAIQYGMELGIPPMSSLRCVAVINGMPKLWGDGLLGVCTRSPVFDHSSFKEWIEGEGMDAVACCSVRRLPAGQVITRCFSMQDAKVAGLLAKDGPWQTYPMRMLQLRARAFALRDAFPDLLFGVQVAELDVEDEEQVVETQEEAPLVERVESMYRDGEEVRDEHETDVSA